MISMENYCTRGYASSFLKRHCVFTVHSAKYICTSVIYALWHVIISKYSHLKDIALVFLNPYNKSHRLVLRPKTTEKKSCDWHTASAKLRSVFLVLVQSSNYFMQKKRYNGPIVDEENNDLSSYFNVIPL